MNRLLFAFLLLMLPACMRAQAMAPQSKGVAKASQLLEYLQKGEGEKAYQMMDSVMQANLPAAQLDQLWASLLQQCGNLNEQGPYLEEIQEGNQVVTSRLTFANIALQYSVVLNPDGKICGLWFKPASN